MNILELHGFGERLKKLREQKNLTQKEVAARLDVATETISNYERNIQTPRLEKIVELAIIYNSSLDYIIGLNNRTPLYLDSFTEAEQKIILEILENIKELSDISHNK